jgi:uncharacterized protein DUF5996
LGSSEARLKQGKGGKRKEVRVASDWPAFNVERDSPTYALLHLASQMLGKLRVAHAPWVNHGWHVTLIPVAEGLVMPPISASGKRFELVLDLCAHAIVLRTSSGSRDAIPLEGGSIAELHRALIAMLDRNGLPSKFNGRPNEVPDPVPFADDDEPRSYNRDSAERLRDALARVVPIFERFRAGFLGKASPVHFFWGSFDLAVTRFSGRTAPQHPGGIPGLPDRITREAYSHEESSAGFWPGGVTVAEPIFYSYGYPEPEGFRTSAVAPSAASFDETLGEFVLPYEAVRQSADPAAEVMAFLQSTYEAEANLAGWDRAALEREVAAP